MDDRDWPGSSSNIREGRVDQIAVKPTVIDVGHVIDESKLNAVSVRVILLCGLIMLMDGYDYTIITVAAPVIREEWSISATLFGVVFSAAMFGYLFGAVIFGTLSDIIGRKKTLIIASLVFSAGTLLVYFSHTLQSLIPIRVFTGIGIGGAVPCAITLTSEYAPLKGRGKYVSIMYSGFLVGIVAGGYVAGFMLQKLGWRPLFLVGFIAPVLTLVLLFFKLPESARWLSVRAKENTHREMLAGLIHRMKPDIPIDANTQFVSSDPGRKKAPVKELFAGRLAWVTPVVWAYYLISSIAVFSIGSWSPQLLVVKGFTAATAAYITGSGNILIAIGCLVSGFYFDKFGFRWGSILHFIAAICVFFLGGMQPLGFVILLFASGFFINSAHMAITILAPIVYPSACRNQGAGTAIAVARIGAMLGPTITGILLDTQLPLQSLIGLISIPLVISAVLCYVAGRQYDYSLLSKTA
jgi:AAHS family 4-hydroxybenzoate transporter-like MFS transporter